jgi:NADH-ubiquinone oxidoreductase chain 2
LLSSNAVTLRRDISILFSRIAIIVLLYSISLAICGFFTDSLDRGIGLFNGLFHSTSITQTFHIFIFSISAAILQLTAFYPRKVWIPKYASLSKLFIYNFVYYRTKIVNKMAEQFRIIEYPLILLFIINGAVFLVSTSDLVSIFLSIELQSYGLYLLSTIYRNSELATSGGLTYFLLGGLSSCFILLGTSLLYANSGSTNLDGLYIITSLSDISDTLMPVNGEQTNNVLHSMQNINILTEFSGEEAYYINFSLLILSVGFLFKVSAAPFHFWSPDVYDAIPTIVTTFVAIVAKISIFIFLLELVHYTSNSLFSFKFTWTSSLLVSSLLSLIIGTVLGLTQFRIKRLFAYSTISHVGFILLALSINSIESIQAFIFYLMQYSISNLNVFVILLSIGYSLYYYTNNSDEYKELADKNNSPIQLVSQIKGFFYINPVLALSFAITIFSFAGIPPLIGFFAKQMVLSAALDSGYIFLTLVAILTSVISAVYYLNIIKEIFFDKSDYKINPELNDMVLQGSLINNGDVKNLAVNSTGDSVEENKKIVSQINKKEITFKLNNIVLSSSLTITISVLTLIILLFIFIPREWLSTANILALILFNT